MVSYGGCGGGDGRGWLGMDGWMDGGMDERVLSMGFGGFGAGEMSVWGTVCVYV